MTDTTECHCQMAACTCGPPYEDALRDECVQRILNRPIYVFTYGPSPSYRTSTSKHETLQHARDAARMRRMQGWSTSAIKKESK